MSCNCGSSCGCGSDCKCGKRSLGLGEYPDVGFSEKTTSDTIILGVPPVKMQVEGSEMSLGEGGNGCKSGNACKCGNNCSCDPCNC